MPVERPRHANTAPTISPHDENQAKEGTHYERILTYIKPQFVHILYGGRIVEDGGPELVQRLEDEGYKWVREKYPEAARDEDELEAAQQQKSQPLQAVGQNAR